MSQERELSGVKSYEVDELRRMYNCVDNATYGTVCLCSNDYDRHHDVYHLGFHGWKFDHRVEYYNPEV